jgi:hypothetical protein
LDQVVTDVLAGKPESRALHLPIGRYFVTDEERLRTVSLRSPEGDDYNHPVAVRVNRGGEITEVTKSGTQISTGTAFARGVRVEIDFDPETADDPWTFAFWFHKGRAYAEVLQRRGAERTFDTIWRG